MTVLYVQEQGAVVRRDVEQILVTQKGKQKKQDLLQSLPVREIEQVVVYGNVQLTTQAARLLLAHDIDVVLLSQLGRYQGTLSKRGSKFARLRHRQIEVAGRNQDAVRIALAVVRAKMSTQQQLAQTLALQLPADKANHFVKATKGIQQLRKECVRANTLDQVRGFEGKAGAFYFAALQTLFSQRWNFRGRQYHPPPDPFNALLSFGYTLLLKDIESTVQRVGLDPFVGCLHAMEYGRPSLVLDLMEEFRALVVDRAMLDLVLGEKVTPESFTYTGRKERPVEIGKALIPMVISAYEKRAADLILHAPSQSRQKIRRCYELQARIYARVLMGERAEYEGSVQ